MPLAHPRSPVAGVELARRAKPVAQIAKDSGSPSRVDGEGLMVPPGG